MLDVYHKVPHSLNIKFSEDDFELDFLVVKPEYMLLWNDFGYEDLWSLSVLRLLYDLEPRGSCIDLLYNHS